ncbi:hypothetical protein AKO1_002730, partial [Acrasis kona]
MKSLNLTLVRYNPVKNFTLCLPSREIISDIGIPSPVPIINTKYKISVDGSFVNEILPAGAGFVVTDVTNNKIVHSQGFQLPICRSSTEAEMLGAIVVLKALPMNSSADMYIDNSTAAEMKPETKVTGYLAKTFWWLANNRGLTIKLHWVRGHNGDRDNCLADILANTGRNYGTLITVTKTIIKAHGPSFLLLHKDHFINPNLPDLLRRHDYNHMKKTSKSKIKYDLPDDRPHHGLSNLIWNTKLAGRPALSLLRARLDQFFNRDLKTKELLLCSKCNAPASLEHLLLTCPDASIAIGGLQFDINSVLVDHFISDHKIILKWNSLSIDSPITGPPFTMDIRGFIDQDNYNKIRRSIGQIIKDNDEALDVTTSIFCKILCL